jgi:hypothetical protein
MTNWARFWDFAIPFSIIVGIIWFLVLRTEAKSTPLWKFQSDVEGEVKNELQPYRATLIDARDWVNGHKVFKVTVINEQASIIHYTIVWVEYREVVPSKWCAMMVGGQGGTFYTPELIRSKAIDFILGKGNHVLRRTDDQHCIAFYEKNG